MEKVSPGLILALAIEMEALSLLTSTFKVIVNLFVHARSMKELPWLYGIRNLRNN